MWFFCGAVGTAINRGAPAARFAAKLMCTSHSPYPFVVTEIFWNHARSMLPVLQSATITPGSSSSAAVSISTTSGVCVGRVIVRENLAKGPSKSTLYTRENYKVRKHGLCEPSLMLLPSQRRCCRRCCHYPAVPHTARLEPECMRKGVAKPQQGTAGSPRVTVAAAAAAGSWRWRRQRGGRHSASPVVQECQ